MKQRRKLLNVLCSIFFVNDNIILGAKMFAFIKRFFCSGRVSVPQDGRLVGACFGDKSKAERLIMYELKRAPSSRDVAVQRALDRLEHDRSR